MPGDSDRHYQTPAQVGAEREVANSEASFNYNMRYPGVRPRAPRTYGAGAALKPVPATECLNGNTSCASCRYPDCRDGTCCPKCGN